MNEINVTAAEIERVARLVAAVDPRETNGGGVVVDVVRGRRWWSAFDDTLAVRIFGERTEAHDRLVIPARSIAIAHEFAQIDGTVTIGYDLDAGTVLVGSPSASVVVDLPIDRPVHLADVHTAEGWVAELSATDLRRLVRHTRMIPTGIDLDRIGSVDAGLFVEPGALGSYVAWDVVGARRSTVRVSAEATGSATIEPHFDSLDRLTATIDADESLAVAFPLDPGGSMSVEGAGWVAVIRCLDRTAGAWHGDLVEIFELLDCPFHREPDDTYLFGWGNQTLRAELVDGAIHRVRVSRTLIDGVPRTETLLAELNELSHGLHGVRLWWHDGSVVSATDLPCDELRDLHRTVTDLLGQTDQLGRLLGSIAAGVDA